ncbi:MAG: signal peptidase II [Flavobacteriales bacterium]|nr:signal peptidase II [Flavobacteriales bacterium]
MIHGKMGHVLAVALPALLLDQLVKIYVKLTFTLGERMVWLPGVFDIQFIENEGMAFGWVLPGIWGKLLLTGFRVGAVALLWVYVRKLIAQGATRRVVVSLALVLAGAAGNIIDSLFYGKIFTVSTFGTPASRVFSGDGGTGYAAWFQGNVVDMFHIAVRFPEWFPVSSWVGREVFPPIFNVADMAITFGVVGVILAQWAVQPNRRAGESA